MKFTIEFPTCRSSSLKNRQNYKHVERAGETLPESAYNVTTRLLLPREDLTASSPNGGARVRNEWFGGRREASMIPSGASRLFRFIYMILNCGGQKHEGRDSRAGGGAGGPGGDTKMKKNAH